MKDLRKRAIGPRRFIECIILYSSIEETQQEAIRKIVLDRRCMRLNQLCWPIDTTAGEFRVWTLMQIKAPLKSYLRRH